MKVIVFGGGGFIGSAIVEKLLFEGHSVRVFERPNVGAYRKFNASEAVEWMTGDMLSTHDINVAINGMDAVLHLVSTTLPKSSNEDPVYDVQSNLIGTIQMLNSMVALGVKRMVFISSGGTVYGPPQYLPIDEKHPTNPISSYGITKLAIEKYLYLYNKLHGIRTVTLRVTNPYGERQRLDTAQGAIAAFLHKAITGVPIEVWGDGSVTRDYIYIEDVADAFIKALEYEGMESLFNISSGTGTTLNELISQINRTIDPNKELKVSYLPGRPFDVPTSILCNTLASKELGWSPKTDLPSGLAKTAIWAKTKYL